MPLSSTSCFPASAEWQHCRALRWWVQGGCTGLSVFFTSESLLTALAGWHGCSKGFWYLGQLPLVHLSASSPFLSSPWMLSSYPGSSPYWHSSHATLWSPLLQYITVTKDHALWPKLRGGGLIEAKYIATEKLFLPKDSSKSAEGKSFVSL